MTSQKKNGYMILPLRDHNDMIVKAKFAPPDFKDTEKLLTRMKINLLYYQSNYFLFFIFWPYVFGFFCPDYFLYGMGAVLVLPLTLLVMAADNIRPSAIEPQTVTLCFGAIWSVICFGTGLVASVCYFLTAIGIPLSAITCHSLYLVPKDGVQTYDNWKTPMGAIVFVCSLADDKMGLAVMLKDSVMSTVMEKVRGRKEKKEPSSESSTPVEKKKPSISLSGLVKRKKSLSGGSAKDMDIILEKIPPTLTDTIKSEGHDAYDGSEPLENGLMDKWVTYQDIPQEVGPQDTTAAAENNSSPPKSKFRFFKKKPDRYLNDFGEEASSSKSKGKNRRKRASSGASGKSSISEVEFKDAESDPLPVVPYDKYSAEHLDPPVVPPAPQIDITNLEKELKAIHASKSNEADETKQDSK